MTDLDELLALQPIEPPTLAGTPTPRRCRRHSWVLLSMLRADAGDGLLNDVATYGCGRCGTVKDEARSRRGKQSRNYGNRAELSVARKYGGTKIGAAGGPVDIRGKASNTQLKTHRRLPPLEWRKAFQAMAEKGERLPRLMLRFLPGPGLAPLDYFIVPGDAWLDWYGKDDE